MSRAVCCALVCACVSYVCLYAMEEDVPLILSPACIAQLNIERCRVVVLSKEEIVKRQAIERELATPICSQEWMSLMKWSCLGVRRVSCLDALRRHIEDVAILEKRGDRHIPDFLYNADLQTWCARYTVAVAETIFRLKHELLIESPRVVAIKDMRVGRCSAERCVGLLSSR